MASPQQRLRELSQLLESSVDNFTKDVPKLQTDIFKRVQVLLKDIELSKGSIKATSANLRKINKIKREIEFIILNKRYKKEVELFKEAFEKTTDLQTEYFATMKEGFTTPKFIKTLEQTAIASTVEALTESGIRANIVDKAGDIIRRNIAGRVSFSELTDEMRGFLTATEESVGALSRHTSQIVTDAINGYAREYNQFVSDNLNFQWFIYSGALRQRSREFCINLVKKRYVHRSEFGAVAKGNFIPKPKDLKGLKPNTNASTLQKNVGGFQCEHLLAGIADEFVPKNLRDKFN